MRSPLTFASPRSIVAFASILPLLFCGATVRAGPVTVIPMPPTGIGATCAAYSVTLASTGVVDGAGQPHPGACQHSELELTISGQKLADFRANVLAWRSAIGSATYLSRIDPAWPVRVDPPPRIFVPDGPPDILLPPGGGSGHWFDPKPAPTRPYAVAGLFRRTPGPDRACVHAMGLASLVGANLRSQRLAWTPTPSNLPACNAEAARTNPATTLGGLAELHAAGLVDSAAPLLTETDYCGPDQRAAETAVADAVLAELDSLAATIAASWQGARQLFDATVSCTPQCGLCQPGWAGAITCSLAYNDPMIGTLQETQQFVIGGRTRSGADANQYDTLWRTLSGEMTLVRGTIGTWRLDQIFWPTDINIDPVGAQLKINPRHYPTAYSPNLNQAWRRPSLDFGAIIVDLRDPLFPAGKRIFDPARVVDAALAQGYFQLGTMGGQGTTTCAFDLVNQP